MEISVNKTKCMAFSGSEPLRAKITIDDKPVEQVDNFRFLGCDISFRSEIDIDHKITNFNRMNGTIVRTLKGKARKETLMKFYKTMSIPIITYASETWTLNKNNERKLTTAEMRFLRKVQGVTLLDQQRSDDIRRSLNQKPLCEIIKDNRLRWQNHVHRMADSRLPKKAITHTVRGRRPIGRPRKRWSDQL